jgi:hypothetical protein
MTNPFEESQAFMKMFQRDSDLASAKSSAYNIAMVNNGGLPPSSSEVRGEVGLAMALKGYHEVFRRKGEMVLPETVPHKDSLSLMVLGYEKTWERW